jgi:hypothetical protein
MSLANILAPGKRKSKRIVSLRPNKKHIPDMADPLSPFVRDPYAALRYPEYRNFIIATLLFTIALLIQEVALGYELYIITRDPLALGLTGLAEAVPFIGLSLYGGHIADRKSKHRVIR